MLDLHVRTLESGFLVGAATFIMNAGGDFRNAGVGGLPRPEWRRAFGSWSTASRLPNARGECLAVSRDPSGRVPAASRICSLTSCCRSPGAFRRYVAIKAAATLRGRSQIRWVRCAWPYLAEKRTSFSSAAA